MAKIDNDIRFAPLADVLIPSNCNSMLKTSVPLTNEPLRSKAAASSAGKMISVSKAKVQNSNMRTVGLTSQCFLPNSRVNLLNYLAVQFFYSD